MAGGIAATLWGWRMQEAVFFPPLEAERIVTEGRAPSLGWEEEQLSRVAIQHAADCEDAAFMTMLRHSGARITYSIELVGSVARGCTTHFVYLGFVPDDLDMSTRSGRFRSSRVRRYADFNLDLFPETGLTRHARENLGTLIRLDVEQDDEGYWGSERFTSVETGLVQGRLDFSSTHGIWTWGDVSTLPRGWAPTTTFVRLRTPVIDGAGFWESFFDSEQSALLQGRYEGLTLDGGGRRGFLDVPQSKDRRDDDPR